MKRRRKFQNQEHNTMVEKKYVDLNRSLTRVWAIAVCDFVLKMLVLSLR